MLLKQMIKTSQLPTLLSKLELWQLNLDCHARLCEASAHMQWGVQLGSWFHGGMVGALGMGVR